VVVKAPVQKAIAKVAPRPTFTSFSSRSTSHRAHICH
jgi:hypothetical protein